MFTYVIDAITMNLESCARTLEMSRKKERKTNDSQQYRVCCFFYVSITEYGLGNIWHFVCEREKKLFK